MGVPLVYLIYRKDGRIMINKLHLERKQPVSIITCKKKKRNRLSSHDVTYLRQEINFCMTFPFAAFSIA